MKRNPYTVALLASDGLAVFEIGIMAELFGLPRAEFDPWYRLCIASIEKKPLQASNGLKVEAPYTLRVFDTAGTIIVPGWCDIDLPVPDILIKKLQKAHREGARILSVCTGAFVLAAAGLLDGKRATTHWRYASQLAQRFPAIQVDPDVLFVDEGSVITSAGSAAGIDMGLHVIRLDFGAAAANTVARRMVVPPQREGGQQQFICAPVADESDAAIFAPLLDSLRSNLADHHDVIGMAAKVTMSERTFARRFKNVTGTTPHRWLQMERVRAAQSFLETTVLALDVIAERVGFSDAQLLRLHFKRVVGTPPMRYRQTFLASAGESA